MCPACESQVYEFDKSKVIELTDKNLEVFYEKIIISCRYVWMPKSL